MGAKKKKIEGNGKKKTGVMRIGIAKNEICGKGRPLSRHPMTPLFSSFYNAFSHEILIFLCASRIVNSLVTFDHV